ncbi:MAG: thioredoxin domain-containing protein [Candidatus Eisenbacteria bacterium]|nr:thioredoxin domain-containing protein [Candidatus Eisenbacteria bacterium]
MPTRPDAPRLNRLAAATSPYLLQHARNPVDWYPWGPEALERSRRLDKPIFLSIGYAACHWCHVMEHESFEDEAIAALMNAEFVCIKVDREERPDLDDIYMSAVQLLSGSGGWPMTVFLTPDLEPFYGGTYFPPDDRWGRPGMRRMVPEVARIYRERRNDVAEQAAELTRSIRAIVGSTVSAPAGPVGREVLDAAVIRLLSSHDDTWGGFGGAPKFPPSMGLSLLIRHHHQTGDSRSAGVVRTTLDRMARGGIYDHLGGGFARYATDARWQVPHFEKMLYDNALLMSVYAEALRVLGDTPDGQYRRVIEETGTFVLRELTDPAGGFYSSLDADSDGEEGLFYVWTRPDIEAVLGEADADFFCAAFDVTPEGNWEHGRNVLWQPEPPDLESIQRLEPLRQKLFAARAPRNRPPLDDKVLAAWNGLMISAFVDASVALEDPAWLVPARRAASFVLHTMVIDGRLRRSWRGGKAELTGYVEDYAALAAALVDLYEATFELPWLEAAVQLIETALAHYADLAGGFFLTADDAEALLVRPRSVQDGATPSGNAMMANVLLRLAALLDRPDWCDAAEGTVGAYAGSLAQMPGAHHRLLLAVDWLTGDPVEVAIVGSGRHSGSAELLRAARTSRPYNRVVALLDPDAEDANRAREVIALLRHRESTDDTPTAWVCRQFACRAPVTTAEALRDELA